MIFFAGKLPACDARRLDAAIISLTCSRTRQVNLPALQTVAGYLSIYAGAKLDALTARLARARAELDRVPVLADRKSTRLNSSHIPLSRMPSSA